MDYQSLMDVHSSPAIVNYNTQLLAERLLTVNLFFLTR